MMARFDLQSILLSVVMTMLCVTDATCTVRANKYLLHVCITNTQCIAHKVSNCVILAQAAAADEATAAAVCHVPDGASDARSSHQQDCACVAVLPDSASLYCRPLHQLLGLSMVRNHPHMPQLHRT